MAAVLSFRNIGDFNAYNHCQRRHHQRSLQWPVHTASSHTPRFSFSPTSSPFLPYFPYLSSTPTSSLNFYPLYAFLARFAGSELTLAPDPLVVARVIWRLFARVPRLGLVHFSRLSRRISGVAQGRFLNLILRHDDATTTSAGNQRRQERP